MIRFVNNIDDIPDYPSSRVVLIDDTLQSKQAIIDKIEKALDAPYEKDNWDGFCDTLGELQWLKESKVVLIHKSLPRLTAWDLHIYLDILDETSSLWDAEPADSFNYMDFQVYFVVGDKPLIDFFLPGKIPEPKVKAKRAPAVHIGDIFEIPLNWNRKRYMQFVLVDSSQLGAWCVRVFKKDYAIEDTPSIDKIVRGSVDFYCNTRAIGQGVLYGLWTYYGNSSRLGNLNAVVFRTFHREVPGRSPQRWRVWRASHQARYYQVLPYRYLKAHYGAMCPPVFVIDRIVRGKWFPVANVYDDYKGASLIERLRGQEHIPEYMAPKKFPASPDRPEAEGSGDVPQ